MSATSAISSEDMHNLLAALVEQARALAARLGEDPDQELPCHFCGAFVPLWENLLVMQLTGVPAHVRCPPEALAKNLSEVGPEPEFLYDEFSRAVDDRALSDGSPDACSGTIEA